MTMSAADRKIIDDKRARLGIKKGRKAASSSDRRRAWGVTSHKSLADAKNELKQFRERVELTIDERVAAAIKRDRENTADTSPEDNAGVSFGGRAAKKAAKKGGT